MPTLPGSSAFCFSFGSICSLKYLFLTLCLVACSNLLAQTEFSDTEFDIDSDWTLVGPFVTPADAENGAMSARQVTGQDPFMEVTFTRATVNSGSVATWGAFINDTLAWDPAENANGRIGKIDLAFDIEGGGAWSLAVKQGEFVWMAVSKRFIRTSTDHITIEIKNLSESDFVALPGSEFVVSDQPEHPDFSTNGAPITFGLGLGISCPSTSNCTTIVPTMMDIDNLYITVWVYVPLNAGQIGSWWQGPSRAGEGLQMELADGGNGTLILVATTYSYNTLGDQIFMIMVGSVDGDRADVDVFITEGGLWGDAFDPGLVIENQWGTGTIWSCGCNNLRLDLRPSAEYKAQGFTDLLNYDLIHLTQTLLPCPYFPQIGTP